MNVHPANCCWKHNKEIVGKSGLKASRPGSRIRAEAGPVGGLNKWGMHWAHADRHYARDSHHKRVLLKFDMPNTFNSLRRDSFLSVARVRTRGLYSLLWQAYSSQTRLFFGKEGFASEKGIQQGGPIGPSFFVLSVNEAA